MTHRRPTPPHSMSASVMGPKRRNRTPKSKEFISSSTDDSDLDSIVQYIESNLEDDKTQKVSSTPKKKARKTPQRPQTKRQSQGGHDTLQDAPSASPGVDDTEPGATADGTSNSTQPSTDTPSKDNDQSKLNEILDLVAPDPPPNENVQRKNEMKPQTEKARCPQRDQSPPDMGAEEIAPSLQASTNSTPNPNLPKDHTQKQDPLPPPPNKTTLICRS